MFGWDDALSGIFKIADKFIPDQAQKEKFQLELAQLKAQQEAAQLEADTKLAESQNEVNKIEAANSNIFVSGWRPFVGWICGIALGYHFILQPLLAFLCALFHYNINLPIFDMDSLMTLLFGLLGLGAMRSFDKVRGVAK